MAFSCVILTNKFDIDDKIKTDVGFSWPILLIPLIVTILTNILFYLCTPAIELMSSSDIKLIYNLSILLNIMLISLISLTQLFSLSLIPLKRKDIKFAIMMPIFFIITFGLSIFIFAFIYNKLFIKSKIKSGYYISNILNPNSKDIKLEDLNPVVYNGKYKQFYVWIDWYGIKFMRYFNNHEQAFLFIKNNKRKCLNIAYIFKTIKTLTVKEDILNKFILPFHQWIEQTSENNCKVSHDEKKI